MVTRTYLLDKPPAPSPAARFVHWNVEPVVINGLGAAEARIERLAEAIRRMPLRALGVALALGMLLAARPARNTRR